MKGARPRKASGRAIGGQSAKAEPASKSTSAEVVANRPRESLGDREVARYVVLVFVATLIAYLPAFKGGWVWDDDYYVTNNQTLRSWEGLADIWLEPGATPQYYPLVHTTFWLEYRLFGATPTIYHSVNIFLHALNAILFMRLHRQLALRGAFIAGLLFALHPIQVESVAWVTERKNCLSTAFFLLALIQWVRYAAPRDDTRPTSVTAGRLIAAFFFFACALLSKTVTAMLPLVAAVILWWKYPKLSFRQVVHLVPFAALAAAMSLVTIHLERHQVGAIGAEWDFSLQQRVLIAGRVVWFYVSKTILPVGLTFIYRRWPVDAAEVLAWTYPAITVATLGGLVLLRGRIGRGPAAAALIYCILLFPALGFFNVYPMRYSFVADHFQYMACAALCAATAQVVSGFEERLRTLTVLAAGVVLGATTWHQCGMYRDALTLWSKTVERNPTAWIAWNNLGNALREVNRSNEAMACYKRYLELKPDSAEARANLAIALFADGKHEDALAFLREALVLRPDYDVARVALIESLGRLRRYPEALVLCRAALKASPKSDTYLYRLATLLLDSGDVDGAIDTLGALVRSTPASPDALVLLGSAHLARGDSADGIQAERYLRLATTLDPGRSVAWTKLAIALRRLGKGGEATSCLMRAVATDPNNSDAHTALSVVLIESGQGDLAIAHLREAIRIDPTDARPLREFARLSALSPDAGVRAQGLEAAARAVSLTGGTDALALAALASSLRGEGRNDEAVTAAHRAFAIATRANDRRLFAALRAQLPWVLMAQGATARPSASP